MTDKTDGAVERIQRVCVDGHMHKEDIPYLMALLSEVGRLREENEAQGKEIETLAIAREKFRLDFKEAQDKWILFLGQRKDAEAGRDRYRALLKSHNQVADCLDEIERLNQEADRYKSAAEAAGRALEGAKMWCKDGTPLNPDVHEALTALKDAGVTV